MAIRRLLTAAAAAASASASASAASSSSSVVSSASSLAAVSSRTLQDGDGNSYSYLNDLGGYSLQYSSCVRAKVPNQNDDDAVDGNVNFYNGRYHAQYIAYATFHVCGDGSGDGCGSCDYNVEYAMEAGEYLQQGLEGWDELCQRCQENCNGNGNNGGGRRLEDDNVNCNACSNRCADWSDEEDNDNGDEGGDESDYVECREGEADDDGTELYYGPQCSNDGQLYIGVFYDDECTIKTKHDPPSFSASKFASLTSSCVDCSYEECDDLYKDAHHCVNGADQQGNDDEMSVCRAVKKSLTVTDYSGVKKRRSGADAFLKVLFGVLAVSAVGGFLFLSYTYYVRHGGERNKPMLSGEDVEGETAGEGAAEVAAPPGATLA